MPHIPWQVKHFAEVILPAVLMAFHRSITPHLCSLSPALVEDNHHAHTSITQSKHYAVALNLDSENKQAWDSSRPSSRACCSHQLKAFSEKHQNVSERAQVAVELTLFFHPNDYLKPARPMSKSRLLTSVAVYLWPHNIIFLLETTVL